MSDFDDTIRVSRAHLELVLRAAKLPENMIKADIDALVAAAQQEPPVDRERGYAVNTAIIPPNPQVDDAYSFRSNWAAKPAPVTAALEAQPSAEEIANVTLCGEYIATDSRKSVPLSRDPELDDPVAAAPADDADETKFRNALNATYDAMLAAAPEPQNTPQDETMPTSLSGEFLDAFRAEITDQIPARAATAQISGSPGALLERLHRLTH